MQILLTEIDLAGCFGGMTWNFERCKYFRLPLRLIFFCSWETLPSGVQPLRAGMKSRNGDVY